MPFACSAKIWRAFTHNTRLGNPDIALFFNIKMPGLTLMCSCTHVNVLSYTAENTGKNPADFVRKVNRW